jgi:hypothetical protein
MASTVENHGHPAKGMAIRGTLCRGHLFRTIENHRPTAPTPSTLDGRMVKKNSQAVTPSMSGEI